MIAQSVYIHGSLTISYTGIIAESVIIGEPALININHHLKMGTGLDTGDLGRGQRRHPRSQRRLERLRQTAPPAGPMSYNPNSTVTADMWIADYALSNSHPTFTTADQQPLAITFAAGALDFGGGTSKLTASGPHAATCTHEDYNPTPTLLLFSTPPYVVRIVDDAGITHTTSCSAT